MAWKSFELKTEHLAMIKAIEWDEKIKYIFLHEEGLSPFGGENLIEDLGLIIFGKPDGDFDPLSEDSVFYTPEQISHMMNFYSDLPIALELISQLGSVDVGLYKKRFNQKNWVKKK